MSSQFEDDSEWMMMFNALLEYGREHGTYDIALKIQRKELPTLCHENVYKIGRWLFLQKLLQLDGDLRPDRRALLQVII